MAAIQFSGLASGLDTDNIIKELMKVERMKVDKVTKQKTRIEWKKDIWKEMNTKLYDFYTNQVFDLKSSGTFNKKNAYVSDSSISVTATSTAPRGTHKIKVTQIAKGAYLNSGNVDSAKTTSGDATFTISDGKATKSITLSSGSDVNALINKINESGLDIKANYDSNLGKIFINSTTTGSETKIEFSELNDVAKNFFGDMGFSVDNSDPTNIKVNNTGNIAQNGQDAIFEYNGVTALTSSDNEITVNGLNVKFNAATNTDININVTQDTDAIYDRVKEFITKYNSLITEINEKIGADSARGYDPLTSDEKKAMSDDDIKLWEDKIKKSLLRKDSTLTSLLNSMRSIVGSSAGVDSTDFKYHFLSDLGIVTGDYTEKGILHINGDENDPLYAIKTNKLKEAIESDPDKVSEFLNAIGEELYSTMQDKMKSTSLSSALTFFNDKGMDSKIKEYKDRTEELERRLQDVESRYYKQFTAMEKAIQAMNSQGSYIASMLGGQ